MKHTTKLIAFMLSASLTGCATYSGWQPTVDQYNDPNAASLPRDAEECKMLARQAGGAASEAAKGALAGGLLGGAAGAALGAIAGSPGKGAAMGAAAGGLGGAAQAGVSGDEQYKRAYINCLRDRGHKVIN